MNLDWIPQPAQAGTYRAELSWAGDAGSAAAVASALRGWNHLRFEITEEPTAGLRGLPLLLHPRARRLPRRHRPARRHHDPRGPAQGGRRQGRARRHHAASARSTSCSASRGTTSSRPSGTPATAPRCAGCTRSSDRAGRTEPLASPGQRPHRCNAHRTPARSRSKRVRRRLYLVSFARILNTPNRVMLRHTQNSELPGSESEPDTPDATRWRSGASRNVSKIQSPVVGARS